ncbi:MAG TPA: ABC transporter permease [Vicinamibacterales bacterium]|nr:ABC transporter permease [Vicinamibacterales bacterium]
MPVDFRDAVRALRRDRAYTLTVIVTLALTIGATTAVFSIVNGVLLKPLAYRESHQLVAVKEIWRQRSERTSAFEVNEQHFEYWRHHTRTFESLAQYIVLPANLTGVGDATQINVGRVSGSLFDVLGVQAALGRTLTPADEPSDRPEVAVITDATWRQRFGADPGIIGRALVLNGKPRAIVGVLPPDFRLPTERLASNGDAFVPIHMDAERVGWWGDHNNEAVGRLRAGETQEHARAELDVLQAQVSDMATSEAHEPVALASAVTPLAEALVGKARRGLLLLLGAICAVLLIACSNLANLSLTRAVGRLRDAGIRSALGASRSRLVARAAIEQLLLAAIGGALGVAVAWAALRVFVRTAPIDLPRVNEAAIDVSVVAFAAGISLICGAVVAILPVWRTAHRNLEQTLRAGALTTTSDRGGLRARAALLALQVALSLTLLVVTSLLGASFTRLMRVDRGFASERVLLVPVSLSQSRYATEPALIAVYDRLIAAVRVSPGVAAASPISAPPLGGSGQVNTVVPEGGARPRSEYPSANFRFVGPGFFRTMGIAVLSGRPFTDAERPPRHAMPALVSDRTAARLWPGQDALGKRFSRGLPGEDGFEVVGVVADAKITSLERTPPLIVYLPYWWRARSTTSLLVKTAGDPALVMPSLRRAVREIDPDIAIGNARPLDALVDASVAARRYQMQLFVAFGIVALFIATLGVYTVTWYGVTQRRREMNIRVALGARSRQVIAMAMRQGVAAIAAGVVAGTGAALAIGGLVASLLFDVRPRDPLVLSAAVGVIASTGIVACLVAARRGLVIDPASALREE